MLESIIKELSVWKGRRVAVAMSGGVDSSLSAVLLHEAGAEVIGVHMRVFDYEVPDDMKGASCCSPDDVRDARRIAGQYGFSFYSVDLRTEFRRAVIDPFIKDYLRGRTPNPCVLCNNHLKMGALMAKLRACGAEAIATGHYARVARAAAGKRFELRRATDLNKDQTYYLFGLTQDQLSKLILPLGSITKPQARELARRFDLHVHDKRDSVDICFIPDDNYRRFLNDTGGIKDQDLSGSIVNTKGEVLGRHDGIHNFTIGQRRGLRIAGPRPLYVIRLQPETRTVVVGHEEEVWFDRLEAVGFNWVGMPSRSEIFRALVKVRYRSQLHAADITPDPRDPGRVSIRFDEPVCAVTPGQAAVAYDAERAERVLGGGWIR